MLYDYELFYPQIYPYCALFDPCMGISLDRVQIIPRCIHDSPYFRYNQNIKSEFEFENIFNLSSIY
jgi:hypothetical protein